MVDVSRTVSNDCKEQDDPDDNKAVHHLCNKCGDFSIAANHGEMGSRVDALSLLAVVSSLVSFLLLFSWLITLMLSSLCTEQKVDNSFCENQRASATSFGLTLMVTLVGGRQTNK